MIRKYIAAAALAAAATTTFASSSAFAAKLEKVDVVKEGIDMTPVVVKANSNGYTGYQTTSHRYLLRVFAKGKGSSHIYWAAISNTKSAHPMTFHPLFFHQTAAKGTEGWGVFKKSLDVHVGIDNTAWIASPRKLCDANLATQMGKGKSKSDVLKQEWKLTAHAVHFFVAAADSKANNKKRNHKVNKIDVRWKSVTYPVAVVCKKGI